MKRILHVVSLMNRAGQETLIMNLYRNINRNEFQFDFLCTLSGKGDYDDEIETLGGKIYYLPKSSIPIPHLYNLGTIWNYKAFFKSHSEYAIVHFHNYHAYSVLIQILGAKLGGVERIFVHSHNTYAPNPHIHKFVKPLLKLFTCNRLACSVPGGYWMFGNSDFVVINNGIDITQFQFDLNDRERIRKEFNVCDSEKLICHIGLFNYQKNHDFILKIFSGLQQYETNYRLLLVGTGELEEHIIQLTKTLGLSDKVIFAGIRSDVSKLLSACDVFFFPSLFEGLGIVLIEAQANGLPIVCSDAIPQEAIVCENVIKLNFAVSENIWQKALIAQTKQEHNVNNYMFVKEANFDISSSAKQLEMLYRNV